MTLPVTPRIAGPFNCNGVLVDFDFAFKVFASTDIRVALAASTGVETDITAYTVALNANQETNPGGTVTTSTAYAAGYTITIDGALGYSQPTELTNLGGFFPKVIERALDRLCILIQQLKALCGRALVLPVSSTASPVLPAPTAGQSWRWNATADALEAVALGSATPNLVALDVVNVTNYASFAAAIAAIGAAKTTLIIPQATVVSTDVTVPRNVTLWFVGSGALSPAATKTLTINGPVIAFPYLSIFTGAGTVLFGNQSGAPVEIWTHWFGVVTDGSVVDNGPGINKAITAAPVGSIVRTGPGTVYGATGVLIDKMLTFCGANQRGTEFVWNGIVGGTLFTVIAAHVVLRDFSFNPISNNNGAYGIAIDTAQSTHVLLQNLRCSGRWSQAAIVSGQDDRPFTHTVRDCYISGSNVGWDIRRGNNMVCDHSFFEANDIGIRFGFAGAGGANFVICNGSVIQNFGESPFCVGALSGTPANYPLCPNTAVCVQIIDVQQWTIRDSYFEVNGTENAGITGQLALSVTACDQGLFEGNYLNGGGVSLYALKGAAAAKKITVSNNTFFRFVTAAVNPNSGEFFDGGCNDISSTTALGIPPEYPLAGTTYTPARTNVTNVDSSTPTDAQYQRTGNTVTVSGSIDVDATAATTGTAVRLTLPIASDFTAAGQCNGTIAASGGGGYGVVSVDTVNNAAVLSFWPTTNANTTYSYHYTYQIR